MNAFRHCFPAIAIKGCYFHFKHAHQGWLCRNGWKKSYRENNDFRIWINMFGALALMPLESLNECLDIIKVKTLESINVCPRRSVQDIIVYFERTWINGNYPPHVWNYFDFVGRKTNNDLENFNKQANAFIHESKPSIFKFITFVKDRDAAMHLAANYYRENKIWTMKTHFLIKK